MDERHWWFASKLQETFHFGGYDNPTLLEDFLSQSDVVDLINRFLGPGEPNKLFFYCDELPAGGARAPSTSRQLCVVSQLGRDVVYLGKVCLYMLRINTGGEVDLTQMEKDIFCGELKHSVLSSFAALLTEAYGPLLHSQKDWGNCPNETVGNFLQNISKFSASVMELATFSQIHQPPLQRPSVALRNEIIQSQGKGLLSGDADLLVSSESLVNDWIGTIDSLLMDTTDERLEDPQGLPLSELSKWQRRQTLLSAVVEQLRAKECKIVIATIITGKSKLLRRWKNTDLQITDAFNNARDHVRYLQALAPHLEALQSNPTIQSVTSSILPAFTAAVKQLDGLSRAYARSGYLGILFVKLSNVMKQICVRGVELHLTAQGTTLWQDVLGAIHSVAHGSAKEHALIARLSACLELGSSYCNHLQHLKEQLLSPQLSTVTKLAKKGSTPTTTTTIATATWHGGEAARLDSCSSAFLSASQGGGVSLQQVEGIAASSLGSLCARVEQVLGVVDTLAEFRVLEGHLGGLPVVVSGGHFATEEEGGSGPVQSVPSGGPALECLVPEAQGIVDMGGGSVDGEEGKGTVLVAGAEAPGTSQVWTAVGCSTEVGSRSCVAMLVSTAVNKMEQVLETAFEGGVTNILGCVDKDVFSNAYKEYIHGVHQLEVNIIAYLKAVFSTTMPSCRALEIIARFSPVSSRPALQQILQNCLRVAFVKYASELEEIQTTFTAQKAHPPRSRNAPLIAGAIEWSRELLRRVEDPMKVFRENAVLMKSMDSLHVCRLHNKLATTLLRYENLLLAKWRSSLEEARAALSRTLLIREGEEDVVRVNCSERLLEMIAECKLLDRIGVPLPATSRELLQQEVHVKLYKQNLEHILREFYSIVDSIDPAIKPLFDVHVDATMRCLMPGWSTLTWTTLNIDVFQYRVQTTIASLRSLVDHTHCILESCVNRALHRIEDTSLFDASLASAHPWVPHQFTDAIKQAVLSTAGLLCQEVDSVRLGVMEVISLTCGAGAGVEHNSMEVGSSSPGTLQQPSPLAEPVLAHFCQRTFDVLSSTVTRSHDQLVGGLCCRWNATEGRERPKLMLSRDDCHGNGPLGGDVVTMNEQCRPEHPIQLLVDVKFSIPYIHIDPSLAAIYGQVAEVSSAILSILHDVRWWVGPGTGRPLYDVFEKNGTILGMQEEIHKTFEVLEISLDECLTSLRLYDFLWEQDLHITCERIMEGASQADCYEHVEKYLDIENKVQEIPALLSVGPLQLSTTPIKSSLKALAVGWKMEFAAYLHKQAKTSLSSVVEQRESMCQQLLAPVGGLEQLQLTLKLLGQVEDMQNVVDGLYLPVEKLYQSLKVYLPQLPRTEVQQVDGLRAGWKQLSKLAEDARCQLLSEQRLVYERELDKQVQAFTVETIQFRNSFDTEGPLVSGLTPMEAVGRLGSFLDQCAEMREKQELICSVQKLLSMPPTIFIELERTKQDLSFLSSLYKNYQQYIDFDQRFRQELWAEVDLDAAFAEVNGFWVAFQSLPQEQQEWDASRKLRSELQQYIEVLPLLQNLHSKEIRSRHWIQVMSVANCTFQLEGTIFKMSHLLDGNLLQHNTAIEQIIRNAKCELELETQYYGIEEEWSEQVLQFEPYKAYGPILLAGGYTRSLLEELDRAQAQLAVMLMSPHIQPLREDTAQWAAKLASIGEVLLQWLGVQELWHNLEAVFDSQGLGHEFGKEAARFASADKIWKSLMKASIETKNVIQCCLGDDVPKATVLAQVAHELEECKKSLSTYLLSKRKAFPRFYFVPDNVLLSILSQSTSIQSLQPHLRLLFGPVRSFATGSSGQDLVITGLHSVDGELLQLDKPVALNKAVEVWVAELLDHQRSSIHSLLSSFVSLPPTAFSLEDVALNSITQVACTALYMYWTRDCEQSLAQCRYDRRAIPNTRARFQSTIVGKLVSLLTKNYWKPSSGPFSPLLRMKLEAMALFSLWLRDILNDMCNCKLRDLADFEWQRFLRLYAPSTGEGFQLLLRCLDCELVYQCDFLGAQPPPVFTPRSDTYIISFTQAMKAQLGSSIVGPESSGKVELVKGLGLLCGRHVMVVQCSSLTDKKAISSVLEGLAQDGSWACFANFQTLSSPTLAVFSQMVCAITNALRERSGACVLLSGREISVHPKLSMFITYMPTTSWLLPLAIGAEFRTFTVSAPDPEMVLNAHCVAKGFKSARVLANKLVVLHNMVKEQLTPTNTAAYFSVQALCHVLQVASKKLMNTKVKGGGGGGGGGGEGGTKVRHTPEIGGVFSSENPTNQTQAAAGKSPRHDNKGRCVVNLTPVIGQSLPPPVLRDHTLVAQCILSLLGPRLLERELPMFVSMVREVFVGSGNTEAGSLQVTAGGDPGPLLSPQHDYSGPTGMDEYVVSIPDLLKEEAQKAGLIASERWMAKVEQLYTVAQHMHAVVVVGQAAVGKTAAIRTVVAAFKARSSGPCDVRLTRAYPGAFEDPGMFCGHVCQSGDWREGVLTNIIKRAQKTTQTFTWVCMDGPLLPSWVNCITGLLNSAKGIMLANGEQLFLDHTSMKLLFETQSLTAETPASIANCGIVCFDGAVLGWRPVASSWLATRSEREAQCLEKYLNTIMDPICEFVLNKSSHHTGPSDVGLFETCLAYLNSLLKTYTETAEVFSETHVERLFLFSVIWSYGGILSNEKEQLKFSALLKSLTNSIPDDDPKCSVFDYYVDESGEWDVWQNRMTEGLNPHTDLTGNVFVDTADTVRSELLVELALTAKKSVIFSGPHAAGKTTLCSNFLNSRALNFGKTEMVKCIVLNGHSTSTTFHQFMQVNFHHRQGFTYGPKHGKTMNLFIDDLHLPLRGCSKLECGIHEYLRQLMDDRGMFNLAKPNEWCAIEDLMVFATVVNDEAPCRGLDPRLQRHFVVINVPPLKGQCLTTIVTAWTEDVFSTLSSPSLPPTLHKDLFSASLEIYGAVREGLKASTMPGRCHYLFSLGQLASVYQGLVQWPAVSSMAEVGFLWSHEMKRSFVDGICRDADSQWLQGFIDSVSKRVFLPAGDAPVASLALSTIPITVQKAQNGSPSSQTSAENITLSPVSQWTDLLPYLGHHLARYGEEHGPLPLVLSTEVIKHISKLHRAINFPRGNCILVGSLGQPLVSMAKFSLYLAGHTLQALDRNKECAFKDSLRGLFRQAGLEGKQIGVILEERDLTNGWMLDTLSSLLACGELPMLFSNDEMDGLLEALIPSIKRDFPSEEVDPLHYFTARIISNLKIILCLTPDSALLEHQAHDFPGMLRFTHLIRMCDWTSEFLHSSAQQFINSSELATLVPDNARKHLVECMVSLHSLVMQETGQLVRSGLRPTGLNPETRTTPSGSGNPFITYTSAMLGAAPTSSECLVEKMAQVAMEMDGVVNRLAVPYVGPRTFLRFIECFCEFFKRRKAEIQATESALSKALQTLHSIEQGVEEMKAKLSELSQKLDVSNKLSATVLNQLKAKACQVEQSKALLGHCSAVLSAMQMVKEHDRQVAEGEDRGEELLALFGDGKGTRSSRHEVLIQRVRESLLRAEEEEQVAKKAMMETKQQALQWQNKIDRNTIDQIKSLNSPPALVGTIMDLIITLLHQHGAGVEPSISQAKSVTASIGQTPSSSRGSGGSTTAGQNAKMESKQWLSIQLAIGDSQNFLDLINSLRWEEGLSPEAVNLIESRLATSKVTEETPLPGNGGRGGSAQPELITVRMAKHAAECVSVLCSFAIAIVIYTKSFKPFKVVTEKIQRLKQELSNLEASLLASSQLPEQKSTPPNLGEVVEEVEVSEEEVHQLQQQLLEMKRGFDKVVVERHILSQSYQAIADKLRSSNHLLESLKPRQEAWLKKLNSLPGSRSLLVDCVLASAISVYCGPLSTNARHKAFASLKSVCSSLIVEGHPERGCLLTLSDFPAFVLGETSVHHLNGTENLPQDLSTQISASLILHPYVLAWPLIIDKLGLAVQWLKAREGATVFANYKSSDTLDSVWKCMMEGTTLVVSEVETADLPTHKLWMDVLQCKDQLHNAQGPLKLNVGDKKIECSPQFKLFLTTADAVTAVPAEVASHTNLIVFRPEREGLEGLLLDQALKLHNAKTFEERQQLRKVVHTQALKLVSVEEDMLKLLAGNDWEDQRTAKNLLQLNKAHEDAQESMSQALTAGQTNDHHLTSLHTMANQASVIMEVVLAMGALRAVYWASFSYVQYVFLTFVEQAGTVQGEETAQKMIHSIYTHFLRGYLEKDRLVFSLLLALEVEASRGQATREEREFLMSPAPGRQFAVKGVVSEGGGEGGPSLSFGRKPFDWMTDAQWQMLLMLASNFGWIQEILERISKDSKEAFWRSIGESVAPEVINISEGIGYKLFPLQQLLILKAMRPERATQCIMAFISTVLDPKANKLAYDSPVDFGRLTKGFRPGLTCLLVYREDPNLLLTRLKQMASRAQRTLMVFTFHGTGTDELSAMAERMAEAQSQGSWLLLHNIHTSPPLLEQLAAMVEHPDKGGEWRLWLSSHADHILPTSLLHRVTKVSTDSPKSLRSTMLHGVSSAAALAFNASSRPEYLPLIHNACMLHALLRVRRDVYTHAWTEDYTWTHTNLVDMLSYIAQEFRASEQATPGLAGLSGVRPVSWTGIRFMISEVFYGAAVTSGMDALLLSSLVDYWIHPGGPRREHGHYYIPALFFTPNSRLAPLLQAIEGAVPPLVLTADLCGFHYTPAIKLGWMDYLLSHMPRLCNILDQHMTLQPATPTPFLQNSSVAQSYRRLTISSTSTGSTPINAQLSRSSQQPEKMAASLLAPPPLSQLAELNLSAVPKAVLYSLGTDSSLLRELPLLWGVDKLMEVIPTGWKKNVVLERLKKHGLESPFALFIQEESNKMTQCLQAIHSSLQDLQNVLSPSCLGDALSEHPHLVDLALSILTLSVPKYWLEQVGVSAPPGDWPLKDWIRDLVQRFAFIDRVLTGGLAKTPTYWLGGFFSPQAFLNVVQQSVIKSCCSLSGPAEQVMFVADLTARDKDHIRDPPAEGELFVHSAYLWGIGFEKTATLELRDVPPKPPVPTPLPLLHLTITAKPEPSAGQQMEAKGPYQCPVYVSNRSHSSPLFTLNVSGNDVGQSKWAMRNLACTLRPF